MSLAWLANCIDFDVMLCWADFACASWLIGQRYTKPHERQTRSGLFSGVLHLCPGKTYRCGIYRSGIFARRDFKAEQWSAKLQRKCIRSHKGNRRHEWMAMMAQRKPECKSHFYLFWVFLYIYAWKFPPSSSAMSAECTNIATRNFRNSFRTTTQIAQHNDAQQYT